MKTLSLEKLKLVTSLALVIERRKSIEKEEKALKDQVKEIMGDSAVLEAGNYCVMISTRNRKDLDKDAIMHDFGFEFFKKYEKLSSYEVLEVKSALRKLVTNE